MNDLPSSSFLARHHRLLFYSCWLLLGLLQSRYTELLDDEAYYWVYSQYLDWGYFDHPPMIGLLVKMGYALFPNELGVRLYPVLLNMLSLLIIEHLIGRRNSFLFYAIALSIAVLQVVGFVAVPDIPLIFFTALFFLCYKRFIERYSLLNSFLLGLSVSLLFYSKYHAILIVFFTLLSNFRLFTRYQTYFAGIIALLVFAPHLWWQYEHSWVSFRYHLFESNVNAYKVSYTTEYILGQLLLPGPIAGLILLPAAFLYRPKSQLEKAMRFTMIGVYVFFLLSSFRGRVEANWTSPVLVPLIILAHRYLEEKIRWQVILYKLLPVSLVIILMARIVMILDLLPVEAIREKYHSWKKWPAEMKTRTGGLPIVFSNSYQRASKYWFYSGQLTYSQNWYRERKNNFNFWPIEDSLLGKPVYFIDKYRVYRFPDSLKTAIGWLGYQYDSSFASFAKIQFKVNTKSIRVRAGEPINVTATVMMPAHYQQYLLNRQTSDSIKIAVFNKNGWFKDLPTSLSLEHLATKNKLSLSLYPALPKGKYFIRFTIQVGAYNGTHNSDKIMLDVD